LGKQGLRTSEKLSDRYRLGRVLGSGAFGIVFSSTIKTTGEKFAVKKVSTASKEGASSREEVDREVSMLHRLAGFPGVVRLHDVYVERHAVFMVLDFYQGGDLIDALERHWSSQGDVPMTAVQNISRQMFQSIEFLHKNGVVHRDIKADNFLVDQADLGAPSCRVCLTDFGLARDLRSDERLQERCGTSQYWAPEVFDSDYAFKVDVWAAGITMYGLVGRMWPFASEDEKRTGQIDFPPSCSGEAKAFMLGVLTREEPQRPSASEAAAHPFLAPCCADREPPTAGEPDTATCFGGDISTPVATETADSPGLQSKRKEVSDGGLETLSEATTASSSGKSSCSRRNHGFQQLFGVQKSTSCAKAPTANV
jgi:serine/threonine protein kinase